MFLPFAFWFCDDRETWDYGNMGNNMTSDGEVHSHLQEDYIRRRIDNDTELQQAIAYATKRVQPYGQLFTDGEFLRIDYSRVIDAFSQRVLRDRVVRILEYRITAGSFDRNSNYFHYGQNWKWTDRCKSTWRAYKRLRGATLSELTTYWVSNSYIGDLTFLKEGRVANATRKLYASRNDIILAGRYCKNVHQKPTTWGRFQLGIADAMINDLMQPDLMIPPKRKCILYISPDYACRLFKRLRAIKILKRNLEFVASLERWRHSLWAPHGAITRRHYNQGCDLMSTLNF